MSEFLEEKVAAVVVCVVAVVDGRKKIDLGNGLVAGEEK